MQICFAQEGWINRSKPGCSALVSVYFANEDIGWAVSLFSYGRVYKSHILKTSDGGMTWTQQNSEALDPLFDIYFTNDMEGITVGSGGKIFRTTDAGENWVQQSSGTVLSLNSICSIDASNFWIVGGGENIWSADTSIILHSTDGGVSWAEQSSSNLKSLFDVIFTDINNGWAVGNYGTILRTTNGGNDWIPQISGTTNSLNGVYFIDAFNGWAVGVGGTILQTTNGGVSFVEEEQIDEIATTYFLSNNFPNPFNPTTKIKYQIPELSFVTIKLFDVLGNEIETLVNEEKPAGTCELTWNAASRPSGVYFYQLKAGSFIETKKMLLLK
jgi:photosystem II stability/assembly factor-like uncharacterized protein